ncbi:uncharacterized protein [Euwallacea fornicatus]|uniref:uncharacterized protein isoform X2 n=1 Tax=Euwallacea fornicatus TaxID=995702 RepID=UPI00338F3D31
MSGTTGRTSDFTHNSTLVTINSRRNERSRSERQSKRRSGTATASRSKSCDSTRKNRSPSTEERHAGRKGEITQRGKGGKPSKLEDCVCGLNIYGTLLGPTVDEQILAGLLAVFEICHECPDEKWGAEFSRRSGISKSEKSSSDLTRIHSAAKAASVICQSAREPASSKSESTRSPSTISSADKSQSRRSQSVQSSSVKSESVISLSERLELMKSLSTRLPCMRSSSARFPSLPSVRRSASEHIPGEGECEEGHERFERESLLIQRLDEEEGTSIQAKIKKTLLAPLEEVVAIGVDDKIESFFSASEDSRLVAGAQVIEEHHQPGHVSPTRRSHSEDQYFPEDKDENLQLEHVHQPSDLSLPHSPLPTNHSPENSAPRIEEHHEPIRHQTNGHPRQPKLSLHELPNRSVENESNLKNHDARRCCFCCRCMPSPALYESKMGASLKLGKTSNGSTKASRQEHLRHKEPSSTTFCPYLVKATFKPFKKNSKKKYFTSNCTKSKARMVSNEVSVGSCNTSTTVTVGEEVAGVGGPGRTSDVTFLPHLR